MMARTWHVCTCTCCGVCVVEQAIDYNTRLLHPLKSPQRAHIVGEVREEKGVDWQGHEDAIQAAQRALSPTAEHSIVFQSVSKWGEVGGVGLPLHAAVAVAETTTVM
jgi:hypothetical protein